MPMTKQTVRVALSHVFNEDGHVMAQLFMFGFGEKVKGVCNTDGELMSTAYT